MEAIFFYEEKKNATEIFVEKLKGTYDEYYDIKEYAICPHCTKIESMYSLMANEDLKYPMIFCGYCDAVSVLLPDTAKTVPADYVKCDIGAFKNKQCVFFAVKLALIKKTTDYTMGRFYADVTMPDNDARKLSDDFKKCGDTKKFVETNELAKKYKVNVCNGTGDPETLNIGIAVDSYNWSKPKNKYPESMNLEPPKQRPCYGINLLCVDENDKEFHLWFI